MTLYRAQVLDTPDDPFRGGALRADADAGLLVVDGMIVQRGPYAEVRRGHRDETVVDLRSGLLLPGFVDTHVHYPQVRAIGALGMPLLEWLERCALPEEARLADLTYAREVAGEFVASLVDSGTTTALVFGSHFAPAVDVLFEESAERGLRITCGLVVGDRLLWPELHTTARRAYDEDPSWRDDGTRTAAPGTRSRPASRCPAPTSCWHRARPCTTTSPVAGSPRTSTRTRRRSPRCGSCSDVATWRAMTGTVRSAPQRLRAQRAPQRRRAEAHGRQRRDRRALPDEQCRARSGLFPLIVTCHPVSRWRSVATSVPVPGSACSRKACRPTSCSSCAARRGCP